jgi:endonuclease/exonuclease/phosphatase family metal-dependent hydrolase
MTQTVYVRVSPSVSDKIFRKPISFIYNGISLNQTVDALGTSLPDGKTLRVVNWNMRWFGDPLNCNCDTTLSRQQATTILKDLQADIYCLQEIVSISQLNAVRQALGTQYQLFVSPFGSGATSSSSGNYPGAQKLAYLINTQKVIHAGDFGLTASQYPGDTSAYACFASGRYPYVLKAALKQNSGPPDTLIVVNIHAKAGSTSSDYNRRVCASQWMVDSLNALFPIQKKLIVGDFNDYLEGSSVAGQSTSPFQNLFTSGYVGVTLPSVYPGQTTYLGSADHLIDNVVFSQNMSGVFPDSACFIFSEAPRYISDYEANMSDHLPVMSYYKFNNPLFISENTSVSDIRMVNPSKGRLQLYFNQSTSDWSLKIYDLCGKLLNQSNHAPTSSRVEINLTDIQPGMYIVQVQTKSGIWQQKWLNLE